MSFRWDGSSYALVAKGDGLPAKLGLGVRVNTFEKQTASYDCDDFFLGFEG